MPRFMSVICGRCRKSLGLCCAAIGNVIMCRGRELQHCEHTHSGHLFGVCSGLFVVPCCRCSELLFRALLWQCLWSAGNPYPLNGLITGRSVLVCPSCIRVADCGTASIHIQLQFRRVPFPVLGVCFGLLCWNNVWKRCFNCVGNLFGNFIWYVLIIGGITALNYLLA